MTDSAAPAAAPAAAPPAHTTVCISGGGPAGMMLGLLLARAGIRVTVLEKHKDFFRDFRGDTIHTSTLELMRELGLLEAFLRLPHQKAYRLGGRFGSDDVTIGEFKYLPTPCKFVAFMPQWDFLDFLQRQAACYPAFDLRMQTKATGLLRSQNAASPGRVSGVAYRTADGSKGELTADLVVACDGRDSTLRHQSGLPVVDLGAPLDVLWFRLPRMANDPHDLLGRIDRGQALVLIDRGDYWQCAYLIPKGGLAGLQARGLPSLRAAIAHIAPFAGARLEAALPDWDALKLLSVQVNRLHRWHAPGLLCIGDAAHAMSPVGGVGINLAIQDAVATANILYPALLQAQDQGVPIIDAMLEEVQARREKPTRLLQAFQLRVQDFLYSRVFAAGAAPVRAPVLLRLVSRIPLLRGLLPRLVALGPRREHIVTPEMRAAS
ncbi:MAG: FAD-dependent oxidoreductase [Ferrovibrio sp.]|uniref:FAD-dependent oxidoreductase n=1 Tax=Ferrovibrio sp. TaxID=1917215 RepID=UPI0026238470|nr:FAD-dependent oxidoreductase [Ferrovibrio sp.]MCW0234403.1 FAD-dependent oxidoreductase [Ferrovibrio sp.]